MIDVISDLNSAIHKLEVAVKENKFCQWEEVGDCMKRLSKVFPSESFVDIETVENIVLKHAWNGTKEEYMAGNKSHKSEFVRARAFVYLFAQLTTGASLHTIGKKFNKTHATVLHSIKTMTNQLYIPENKAIFSQIVSDLVIAGVPLSYQIRALAYGN